MIQASELRIGNWYDHYGTYLQTTPSTILEVWESERLWCKPIPLTHEVLEKCEGFYQLPHFTIQNCWIYNIQRDRFITIACVGTPNEMVFLSEEESEKVTTAIVLRNFDFDGKTYLHQLQNIIFDLTGKELQFKP